LVTHGKLVIQLTPLVAAQTFGREPGQRPHSVEGADNVQRHCAVGHAQEHPSRSPNRRVLKTALAL
jgi:hypothetical protein